MNDIVNKVKTSEKIIAEAKEILKVATPYSNKEKKAKATIQKHEKIIKKLKARA